jgi:predicted GIY-YIG superfamily endonuclease
MDKIYVLRLHNDKWYVGRTSNVERRFEQHKNGDGAKWTFLHKPINIHEIREIKSDNDEDRITREYMKQFGIYNVRGGRYCAVEFKHWHIKEIKQDMNAEEFIKNISELKIKVSNELFNPDSDFRSGRWFSGLFGV